MKKNHGHQMIMKISALRVIGTSRRPAADRLQDTRRIAHKKMASRINRMPSQTRVLRVVRVVCARLMAVFPIARPT